MSNNNKRGITTKEALANNWYILKLAWSIHPQRVAADFAKIALEQFATVFYSVIFVKYLIESMEQGGSFQSVASFIIGTLLGFMFINLFHQWYDIRFKPLSDTTIYEKLYAMIFRKAADVELQCYEDADFYDTYTTAIKEVDSRVGAVVNNLFSILFAVIAAASVFGVMFFIDPYVVLFALFPLIGDFAFGRRMNQLYYLRYMDNIKNYRKMDYVNRTLYLQSYAKEIRLTSVYQVLKRLFHESYAGVIEVLDRYKNRLIVVDLFRNFFTFLLISQGVLFYGAYLAMIPRSITIGEFAILAAAMATGSWILIGMGQKFVSVYENGVYINNLRHFLNYESTMVKDGALSLNEEPAEIRFSNVSFAYKGAEHPSLHRINLTIPKHAKIALVGHNGAGKTTLIKLLMRLYDPSYGAVLLNGIPIQEYDVKQYRKMFGAAFQDYQVFSMTIAENVLMREPRDETDRELVRQALKKSGVYDKVMSLPQGIDTILTREFDDEGAMLSGGELQKIAIARVFARDVKVVIMDEPSSALDPIAEYQLYESIAENCADKTVIFISHRLSSAVIADRIYMFEDGGIIEEGTHVELMGLGGRYADMFRKQAEKYVETAG
jgi:ATP-binding cassette, subfamily B, bacterial